jgi:hypothetical protein
MNTDNNDLNFYEVDVNSIYKNWSDFINVFKNLLLDRKWRDDNDIDSNSLLNEKELNEFLKYEYDYTEVLDKEFWINYKKLTKQLNKIKSKDIRKILDQFKNSYFEIDKNFNRTCCFILSEVYDCNIRECIDRDDLYSGLLSSKIRDLSIKLGWVLKLRYGKIKKLILYNYIRNNINLGVYDLDLKIYEEQYKYIKGVDDTLEKINYWEPEDKLEYNKWLNEIKFDMNRYDEIGKEEYIRLRNIKNNLTSGNLSPKWYMWNCGEDYELDILENSERFFDYYKGIKLPLWEVDNYYTLDYNEVSNSFNKLPNQKLFNKFFKYNENDKNELNIIFYKNKIKMRVHYFIDMKYDLVSVYRLNSDYIKKKFSFQLILKSNSSHFRYDINKVVEYMRLIERRVIVREENSKMNRKI